MSYDTAMLPVSLMSFVARALIFAMIFNNFPSTAFAARRNAVATQAAEEAPDNSPADTDEATELAPGFLIQLSSTQDSKLNGAFRIQINGNIELPYAMQIDTKGLSLGQFRHQISKAYASY